MLAAACQAGLRSDVVLLGPAAPGLQGQIQLARKAVFYIRVLLLCMLHEMSTYRNWNLHV